ncbi:MAG: MerR family transcriptional regulator [Tetrasphaera sp.]|nr:MerR family transcriptional regulator [Tetrasphaera sp.]
MLTVGGVVKALAADFPGITVSKVRFLEAEGIVTPARTAAGYRQFSAGDLERLRFALTAQRDRFWPLRRVREALDALDRGVSLEEFGATVAPVAATPSVDLPRSQTVRLTRAELLSASGLEPAMADDLVSYGLLTPSRRGHFSAADLQVARAAAQLAAYGIEGRHLRMFRTAADREVSLIEQVLAPRPNEGGERAASASEIARWCLTLHAALVAAGIETTAVP